MLIQVEPPTGYSLDQWREILVAGRPSREQLAAFPDLQALIVPWTGIPPGTLELIQEFPHLTLHNLHHNATPVAEMAVALLLASDLGGGITGALMEVHGGTAL